LSDLTVEATGETVGEAKWAALRELEQRFPSGGGGSVAQPASQTTPARATSRNSGDFSVRTINELLAGSSQPARPDVSG